MIRVGHSLNPVDRYQSAEHVLWYAPTVSEMCKRLEKPIYPGLRPQLEKRIRRRMTKIAQLYAHAPANHQSARFQSPCRGGLRRSCAETLPQSLAFHRD
jgi:hypothetical protein